MYSYLRNELAARRRHGGGRLSARAAASGRSTLESPLSVCPGRPPGRRGRHRRRGKKCTFLPLQSVAVRLHRLLARKGQSHTPLCAVMQGLAKLFLVEVAVPDMDDSVFSLLTVWS